MTKSKGIPAIPFQKILRQYAMANGIRLWTVRDRMKAIAHYELFQSCKN